MDKIALTALALAAIVTVAAWTKYVWQSGFDQGSDVALCVVASVQNGGKLAIDQPACENARAYRANPLWALRRRDGGRP